jgi:hypothetical protein
MDTFFFTLLFIPVNFFNGKFESRGMSVLKGVEDMRRKKRLHL